MIAAPGQVTLRAAIGHHPYLTPLRDGTVTSERVKLAIEPFEGSLLRLMQRMVRMGEFDVCEMSPTSYLMARTAGAPLIGLPVFPYRLFPFGHIVVREDSPISGPADLAGARIGVRTWAQPISLWLRHIFSVTYSVDLSRTLWTFVAEDPVATAPRPAGSTERVGESLYELLDQRVIDAAMGVFDVPDGYRPLFADPVSEARDWYARSALIPANHLIVVRSDVAERVDLLEIAKLFDAVKSRYLDRGCAHDADIEGLKTITGLTDPLPNGWSANEPMWTTLIDAMMAQRMLDQRPHLASTIEQMEIA